MSMLALSAITAGLALVLALVVGRYAQAIGDTLRLLDFPDTDGGRKRHNEVTPLVGGLAVAGAAIGSALLTMAFTPEPVPAVHLGWLAATVAVMFLIGVADDRFHLSPKLRLAVAITMLLLVVSFAPDFSLAFVRFAGWENVWLLGSWGDGFSLLCLVGLLNAVNMADGKNGIVIGMGIIWTLVLASHMPAVMLPVLAGVGAALVVLGMFNMAGKLFLGDGGSYAISALFGLLAIYIYNHDFETMRADDVAVMFAIPVFDTIRLMIVRMAQLRSPFEGDRDHFHHHLHARIGWPRGLWVYLALVALPNAGAVAWPGTGLAWLVVSLVGYTGVLLATRFPGAAGRQRPAE